MRSAKNLTEEDISELLVTAINGNELTPGSTCSRYTPCFEPTIDKTSYDDSTAIFDTAHIPSKGHPRWPDLSVPVEVYTHRHAIDPFDYTDSQDLDANERLRHRILEHISTVADLLFAAQRDRVFLFMILIIGRRFRFLRLDRAGIITTPSIDCYEDPHVLCDILWRVSQLNDIALGFDPTATRVLPGDVNFSRMDFLAISNPSDLDDTERVQVRDGKTTRNYLIGKPSFRSGEFLGRGTCGYVAYDCKRHSFVWFKDAWRASYMLAETEGDVLRRLNSAGVSNVPTLVCDGDVGGQSTITADWWEQMHPETSTPVRPPPSLASSSSSATLASSASPGSRKRKRGDATSTSRRSRWSPGVTMHSGCPLRQHKHYRVVVEEVCMPLKSFQYGRQLVSVVLDCLRAHYQAAIYPKTRLLHCDISGGNILICPKIRRDKNGENPMVELSKPVDTQDTASRATQADRMGTYEFMSVNLLNHIAQPVKISDELESFFHVLVYYAVRHLRSNCTGVTSWIDNYFHRYSCPERMLTCGQKSYAIEVTGRLQIRSPDRPLVFDSPLEDVLATILESLHAHYKVAQYDLAKARPPPPPSPPPPLRPSLLPLLPLPPSPSSPSSPPPPPLSVPRLLPLDFDDVDDAQLAQWEAELEAGPLDNSPTAEDRALARNVAGHRFVLDLLLRTLRDPRWCADDRIPSVPDPQCGVSPATSLKPRSGDEPSELARRQEPPSNKRQRTSGPESKRNASLPVPVPARLRAQVVGRLRYLDHST
ncbi:hypothetical protein GSI_05168 [Ganoderma sinense ZZ0214-1]|uniref:Fungal-type protein kinase domain-containing protein n=1 Tax=Ganoderma sinense ZZ0214-1 TaxID=1077348 RepID=A0A2G8SFB6_9APHY|nr:hypothetical protein GSI_05168 [Ganoderma sinense ZZ0214-1]